MNRIDKLRCRLPRGFRLALVAPLAAFALLGSSTAGLTTGPTWRSSLTLDLAQWLGPVPTLAAPSWSSVAAPVASRPEVVPPAPVWLPRPHPPAAGAVADRRGLSLRVPYAEEIRRVARRHDLDALLLASLVEVESGFRADALSNRGAAGLLQLMPDIAQQYGLEQVFEPEPNLDAGASYLQDLQRLFDGDPERALAAYFAGPTAVLRQGTGALRGETRLYVDRVLAAYARRCRVVARPSPAAAESEMAALGREPLSAAAGAR